MGVSNSRLEEDQGLQLCRARKKFIKQALNGRCSLAAAHIAYIEELRNVGAALRNFTEIDLHAESAVHLSRSPTPGPHSMVDNPGSQLSLSPLSLSHAAANTPPSSSTPVTSKYQSHRMKFRGAFSRKVEEKPPAPVAVSVSSTTPPNMTPLSTEVPEESSFGTPVPPETPPWDYFGLFHPIDNQFAAQEGREFDHGSEFSGDTRHPTAGEGVSQTDVEGILSSHGIEESQGSEDEFDEPSSDTLVRKFRNVNRTKDNILDGNSPVISSESRASDPNNANVNEADANHESVRSPIKPTEVFEAESKSADENKNPSPALSPLRATSSRYLHYNDVKITPIEQDEVEDSAPKNFYSSMKEIEQLFVKASESGKEVPRMLEANKFHFRPVVPGSERGSVASAILKSCFSCGEDPSEVPKEPPQNSVKYLTWHRTTSSRSASSQNLMGLNASDGPEESSTNLFDNFCMVSGSHASTLDRLYAWEKKLYDEVKAAQVLRTNFDTKCRLLRQQESRGEQTDKTRAVVKDLHTRIKVAIHRIDSISKKIEDIRDKELQPQLEELIDGLKKMWESMVECHNLQFHIISVSHAPSGTRITIHTDSRRQATVYLEHVLSCLASAFTKSINAQMLYVEAINKWLYKCVTVPQNNLKRNKMRLPPIQDLGPPIYMLCASWLNLIEKLPTKQVVDSMKDLSAEVAHFLPRQEKKSNDGVVMTRDEASEDWIPALDRFRTNLAAFLGQMNNFAESSVRMFDDLQNAILDAKNSHEQFKLQQQQQRGRAV
ncbi:protein ALTERED PHOSPHATE STARVATION RESPONSE 1 [Andrographis paniculata]|uniref:protein ALTERED PHOSPHATE STARVATION RESPONSE 1 n=1 Tax=Andrographis paniculata TaxID=175694 RepID=UPI0021E7C372|nr:protein ALTERED PHOSPHATE STARVATION RESPONSE 1 [Andrographis paniculata]XP_051134402.1 protein ALTERED PHOSPHATE STARVATION RESPONSE 1 [Andrographis paniculata]XP_051134403.1 protein ALTERED PHOSPHATE STARVATION RESPONSE 1 [Andrographis paniculata]